MKKLLPLILCLFSFGFISAQTTYNFNSGSTISGGPGGFGIWNTQTNITIDGVAYKLTSGGNGSFTNQATGGSGNSKCIRKDGSGGDQFTLQRVDGQPFQFYGLWVKHQSMNSYAEFMSLPPFYTINYTTPDDESQSYTDNTPMQNGSLTTSSTSITNNITVVSVQISFKAIIYYWIDDINVGPALGAAPSITSNPSSATVCAGSNNNFSVTASDATGYQWQVNTGSGFTNISNTAPYSGATTSTLSVTGATSAMTGYQYRCAVSGSGSVTSTAATLTVSTITASASQNNIACNSGSNGLATITAPTGGTAPYSYNWTPGNPTGDGTRIVTGLSAGAWAVTVTDQAGCTLVKNFTLSQPTAITASTSQTNVTCNGGSNGSTTVSASGGTATLSYSWAPSGGTGATASGFSAGTYYCTITDVNECSIVKTITITQPASAPLSFTSQPQNTTANSSGVATFSVSAANATSYQWQVNTGSGFTNISNSGIYSGASSATLTLTSATSAMNGYLYRCVIGALCYSSINSNSATLSTKSSNALLESLGVNHGALSPEFSSENIMYNMEVSPGTGSLLVSPVTSDSKATVTVNGFPLVDGLVTIMLEGGSTSIAVVVTAEDGETLQEYTIKVLRPFISVESIERTSAQHSNAQTCTYTVKFSGTVNDATIENFSLSATGSLSGYSIQSISQTTPDTYTVKAGTGEGDGTLTLNIGNGTDLSAPISGLPYEGKDGYIIDKTDPVAEVKNITVTLGSNGNAVVSSGGVNNGSSDNISDVGSLVYNLNKTIFSNQDLGENTITFTVTDQAGNSTQKQVVVTVQKNIEAITAIPSVNIIYGEQASLPQTVEISFPDSTKQNVSVTWNMSGYNGKAGEYTLTGALTNPAYTTNSEELSAHVIVQVGKRPLHVSLTGAEEKTYDGNTTATPGQDNYASDKLSNDDIIFNGDASYDNKSTGQEKNVVVEGIAISGADAENYALANETANANIGSVVARSLEVSLTGTIQKIYDGRKTASLNVDNFESTALEGDDISFNAYAEYDNKNAGDDKTVTASDFFVSGEDASNYTLTTDIAQSHGSILRKEISASANAEPLITKVYDASVAANLTSGNYSLEGTIEGDDVQASGIANYDTRNAGVNKTVTIQELQLSGAAKNNYDLTNSTITTAGNITPKQLEVSFNESAKVTKTYDGNTTAAIDRDLFYINGIIGEDAVSLINPPNALYDDKHAGDNKNITVNGIEISGDDASNYVLASDVVNGLNGKIVPKEVSVIASAKTKVYGANDPALTYVVGGLVGDEGLSGEISREAGRNVGSYAIQQGTLAGGTDYLVSEFVPAALTVTPASLTIKAEDKTKKQGEVNPSFSVTYSGLVAGDSPNSLSTMPVMNSAAIDRSPIGYYDINVSGAASGNYKISYESGRLSILPLTKKAAGSVQAWSSTPGTIEVRVFAETEQDATITLYTEVGQALIVHKRHLNAGVNKFTLTSKPLASSTYVLSVWAKKFKQGERVQVK